MNSGARKTIPDRRDYDLHKTFGTVAATASLPSEYLVDANLWMPDQRMAQTIAGIPLIPPLPYGCIDYTTTDLCMDEDGVQRDPMLLENAIHVNAHGGGDIRAGLGAAKTVFGHSPYFAITRTGGLDYFDSARLAMYSFQVEKRALSVGSIWYPQWFYTKSDGILSMPPDLRLDGPWHNWTVCGWETIDGVLYLRGKSWQGSGFGFGGYHRISREVFNAVMSQYGTAMFTIATIGTAEVQTVQLGLLDNLVSLFNQLISLLTPKAKPMPAQTTNGAKLYDTAAAFLGKQVAPLNDTDQYGVLGCAITVNILAEKAWGHQIGGGYSTASLWGCLQDTTKFTQVSLADSLPGDIIIAPTGSAPGSRLSNGHVGIVAKFGILSNSSETGHLSENYTNASWVAYFTTFGGIPTFVYRPV